MLNHEYHAIDGQMFCGAISVQVMHAMTDYINKFALNIYCHDPVSAINADNCINIRVEASTAKYVMKDIPTTYRKGCMRQGAEVFHFPEVDDNDPHWKADQQTGVL